MTENRTPQPLNISQLASPEEKLNIPYELYQWHGGNRWWPASLISLIATFLIALGAFGRSNSWPSEKNISPLLGHEPVMGPTEEKPFTLEVDGVVSEIYPLREYTQAAMITSMAENKTGWTYVPGIGGDDQKINTFDGTVVWGENVTSGVFRNMKYRNEGFVGWVESTDSRVFLEEKMGPSSPPVLKPTYGCRGGVCPIPGSPGTMVFREWEFANNHYLPSSLKIQRLLESLCPGDQILIKGILVLYRIKASSSNPAEQDQSYKVDRIAGDVKIDGVNWRGYLNPNFYDNGCEVIYVQDLRVLSRHNALLGYVLTVSASITAGLFTIASFVHFFGSR